MTQATEQEVADFGHALADKIVEDLGASPMGGFDDLATISSGGHDMGFVKVWSAPRIYKFTHMSINLGPGAKYFNLMLTPEPQYDVPRFSHEGMISTRGSQVSTDLYHDVDQTMNIVEIVERTKGLTEIYDEAWATDINFIPSRQTHMRSLCSPHFLNVFNLPGADLSQVGIYAHRYYAEWQKMFAAASKSDAAATEDRQKHRKYMSDMVIALDPDRNMVVQVLGEDTVSAIEQAVMY